MPSLCERVSKSAALFSMGILFWVASASAQGAPEKPKDKQADASQEKAAEPPNPAQFDLLETKWRFEANGDSRKEVHAVVKINSELGVRQFARLNFDYNHSFQSVEIPLVHITHSNGGTADILPSAITDAPNPAVEKFPAYQDVRVKSVRILGLQPGDSLEYRVVTLTTHPPLAPDFWLDHSFDLSGVVSEEVFVLDLPASTEIALKINSNTPAEPSKAQDNDARIIYYWDRKKSPQSSPSEKSEESMPDVSLSTFKSWDELASKLATALFPQNDQVLAVREKAFQISKGAVDGETKRLYEFVSQKFRTVDLQLDATGYRSRTPSEILESGYANATDKFMLFAALSGITKAGFVSNSGPEARSGIASPARFKYLLAFGYNVGHGYFWLDLNAEVAPVGMIPAQFREKPVFVLEWSPDKPVRAAWQTVKYRQLYKSVQKVSVSAALDAEGKLAAKAHYVMRGDNELLLRVTFHQTPPEKQKEIAQYLALSDGFRGKVTSVKTSDPYDTDKPFEVEYELTQEKFVDWSKQPVRIPALLPLPGLPEAPKKLASNAEIELGPPLDVELSGTLRLPLGTTAQAPPGTSVKRDYAAFTSQYSAKLNVLHFSRHLNFIAPELSSDRAIDLNAFLHAVQSDQALLFELEKPTAAPSVKPK